MHIDEAQLRVRLLSTVSAVDRPKVIIQRHCPFLHIGLLFGYPQNPSCVLQAGFGSNVAKQDAAIQLYARTQPEHIPTSTSSIWYGSRSA
jgi:hypothetical protein